MARAPANAFSAQSPRQSRKCAQAAGLGHISEFRTAGGYDARQVTLPVVKVSARRDDAIDGASRRLSR